MSAWPAAWRPPTPAAASSAASARPRWRRSRAAWRQAPFRPTPPTPATTASAATPTRRTTARGRTFRPASTGTDARCGPRTATASTTSGAWSIAEGYVVDESGNRLRGPTGDLLPRAPRTRLCQDWIPERYGLKAQFDGGWYRCCGGTIRKLVDCCAHTKTRINGDAALTGYCYNGRRVFCVLYYQTSTPC